MNTSRLSWGTWLDGLELRIVATNGDSYVFGYITGSRNRWSVCLSAAVNQKIGEYTHPIAAIYALESRALAYLEAQQ